MNLIFICSKNRWRSLTAETIFKDDERHRVKSAGTEAGARIRVTAKLIIWADMVFVMEKKHKQRLLENFPSEMRNKKVITLDITDDYKYMDPELVDMIKVSTLPYL